MDSGTSPESPAPVGQPPGWIARALDHLQDVGLSPSVVERFVKWWGRYGLFKTMLLTAAVLWPVMQYEVVPSATSSLVRAAAEGEGVRLKVADWDVSIAEFAATAHGVVIETSGRYRQPYLLRADSIEVDNSLWQNVRDGAGRLRRRAANVGRWIVGRPMVPQPPRPIGRSIRVKGGELFLEKMLSGRGNWQDAVVRMDAPGAEREAVAPYYIPAIELENFKITYVEHLPANIGSGLEQSLTSTLHLDEATLTLGNFVGPVDPREDPTDFSLDGRVADGRVSVTGAFNLWASSFGIDISFTNVGAATLGVMSPEAALVPESGWMTGHIVLAVRDDELRECGVNLSFREVRYRANPRSPIVRPQQHRQIQDELQYLLINGQVNGPCRGNWRDPTFRPWHAVQAAATARSLQDAPPAIVSLATFDERRFSDVLSPEAMKAELVRTGDQLAQELGARIGEDAGNAVTRGLKSVGRGIGRIFGRKPR